MDTHQVVKELQDERERIVAAIDSLQRLAAGNRGGAVAARRSGCRKVETRKSAREGVVLESLVEHERTARAGVATDVGAAPLASQRRLSAAGSDEFAGPAGSA